MNFVRKIFRPRPSRFVPAALLLSLCSACQQPKPAEGGPGKRYTLTGTVLSVDKQEHTVKIKGNPVPGWMDAMTMDYPVENHQSLDSLHPNESIRATLDVHDMDYKLVDIQPAGKP